MHSTLNGRMNVIRESAQAYIVGAVSSLDLIKSLELKH